MKVPWKRSDRILDHRKLLAEGHDSDCIKHRVNSGNHDECNCPQPLKMPALQEAVRQTRDALPLLVGRNKSKMYVVEHIGQTMYGPFDEHLEAVEWVEEEFDVRWEMVYPESFKVHAVEVIRNEK